jgi:hypothetical protein
MRTRKELIYLNVSQLTNEEKLATFSGDGDLSYCDVCGEIDISDNFIWTEDEELIQDEIYGEAIECFLREDKVSVCKKCMEKKIKGINNA